MSYKILSFDKIPSTQTFAEQLVVDGNATDKTIVMAAIQTAGRGRGTHKKWVSNRGNLYASFIYKTDSERRPTLSYSFAIAAAETLLKFGIPVQIKWPNDLLAESKKISGILLEYIHNYLIVGIGINIKSNPTNIDAAYKTTKTDNFVKGLTPQKIIPELIKQFDIWKKADFRIVKKRFLELSIDIGTKLNYKRREGVYCGLNDTGAMIIRFGSVYELVWGDEIFA